MITSDDSIPDECPACDEPVAESGWDSELRVCRACVEAHEEENAQADTEYVESLEEEFFEVDPDRTPDASVEFEFGDDDPDAYSDDDLNFGEDE